MTLFSLHHGSNFPWLVPPALWRDPGHRAAGGRGKTERVAHPGKTDAHCGVIVLLALRTYALLTIPSGGWREKRPEKTPANVHMNCQGLNPGVWQLSPQPRSHPDVLRVVFVFCFFFLSFGWSQSRHSHVDHRDPPVRLGTMDDEGRGFAKSAQLHPPFFRLLSKTIIDELPKGSLFCLPIFFFQSALFCCVLFLFCLIEGVEGASGLKTRSSVRSTTVVCLSFLITSTSS